MSNRRESTTAYTYTNCKGRAYYLHRSQTRKGRPRYTFKRQLGEGAVGALPDGYEVSESVNGIVSLVLARPQQITSDEQQLVRDILADDERLAQHRLVVRDAVLTVHERTTPNAGDLLSPLMPFANIGRMQDLLDQQARYQPALQFELVDETARQFAARRMTYRGDGGWSHPLARGPLSTLAGELLAVMARGELHELI